MLTHFFRENLRLSANKRKKNTVNHLPSSSYLRHLKLLDSQRKQNMSKDNKNEVTTQRYCSQRYLELYETIYSSLVHSNSVKLLK